MLKKRVAFKGNGALHIHPAEVVATNGIGWPKRVTYTPAEVSAVLDRGWFGLDVVEVFKYVIQDPEMIEFMEKLLLLTYRKFLGEMGERFVRKFFEELKSLPLGCSLEQIKAVFLKQQAISFSSGFISMYNGCYRTASLGYTIETVGIDNFNGLVVDIGANDNRLGERLLSLSSNITRVIGCDIARHNNVIESDNLEFRVQESPDKIPLEDGMADTVVLRYALHHMPFHIQDNILSEIKRVLRTGGNLIVIEEGYSSRLKPILPDEFGLNELICRFNNPIRLRLLLCALDAVTNIIKKRNYPFPNSYRTFEEWLNYLKSHGFVTKEVGFYGIQIVSLHQSPFSILIMQNP